MRGVRGDGVGACPTPPRRPPVGLPPAVHRTPSTRAGRRDGPSQRRQPGVVVLDRPGPGGLRTVERAWKDNIDEQAGTGLPAKRRHLITDVAAIGAARREAGPWVTGTGPWPDVRGAASRTTSDSPPYRGRPGQQRRRARDPHDQGPSEDLRILPNPHQSPDLHPNTLLPPHRAQARPAPLDVLTALTPGHARLPT